MITTPQQRKINYLEIAQPAIQQLVHLLLAIAILCLPFVTVAQHANGNTVLVEDTLKDKHTFGHLDSYSEPTQLNQDVSNAQILRYPIKRIYGIGKWESDTAKIYVCTGTKVGIGTVIPQYPLHVNGTIFTTQGYRFKDGTMQTTAFNPTNLGYVHIKRDSAALSLEGNNNVYMQFYPNGYNSGRKAWIGFGNSGTTDLTISNENSGARIQLLGSMTYINGNLGIGTNSVDAGVKLMVKVTSDQSLAFVASNSVINQHVFRVYGNGHVMCKEVKVTLEGWSDDVFDKEFKLMPLSEVQHFIIKNKHLPNVPSEKEIVENGNNLGEMDAILLRKIEELYLYVLELKKENTLLKQEVEQLKK